MPQFTELAGNTATVNRGNANQTLIGDSLMQMAETFTKIQQAKQQNAQNKLQLMMTAAEKGFPIDPSAVTKVAKQAGLPLMKADDMKGMVDAKKKQDAAASATGAPGAPTSPAATNVTDAQKAMQKNMTKEQARDFASTQWVNAAMTRAQARFKSEADLQKYQSDVMDLKKAAMGGDMVAAGKLMNAGEIPFNLNQVQWSSASPEQRASMIDIAAGHESQADKVKRVDSMTNNLIQEGYFKDPGDAHKYAEIMANGGQIPQDLQGKMRPFTFKDLQEESQLTMDGLAAGVPSDKIATFAKNAQKVGFANALPTGVQPIALQQLNLQKQQLQVEKGRLGVEQSRLGFEQQKFSTDVAMQLRQYQIEEEKLAPVMARLEIESRKAENQDSLRAYQSMLDAEKARQPFPKEVGDAILADFAKHYGLTAEENQSLWHHLGFGPDKVLVPAADKDLAGKAAGGGKGASSSNEGAAEKITDTFDSLVKGAKKAKRKLTGEGGA